MRSTIHLMLPDVAATETLGAACGAHLDASALLVCHLHGELGAGKTTLARSLLRSRGVGGLIRSPTYTLLETYAVGDWSCVHLDLYRLRSPLEVDELGLRDLLLPRTLLLIEWPDRGGAATPAADLVVDLRHSDFARDAWLGAPTPRGQAWRRELEHDASLTPYLTHKLDERGPGTLT